MVPLGTMGICIGQLFGEYHLGARHRLVFGKKLGYQGKQKETKERKSLVQTISPQKT